MNLDMLTSLFWIFLLGVLIVFGFTLYPMQNNLPNLTQNGICGTSSFKIGSQAELGRTVFKNNCAQCHAKNMNSDATGPALRGLFDKWGRDTLIYFSLINNTAERPALIQSMKFDLDSTYFMLNHDNTLTYDEVVGLIHYIEL